MIVVCLLVEESGSLLYLAPYLHKCLCAYIYSLGSSFLTSCRTLSPRQKEGALRRAAIKQVAAYERSRGERLNRRGYFFAIPVDSLSQSLFMLLLKHELISGKHERGDYMNNNVWVMFHIRAK